MNLTSRSLDVPGAAVLVHGGAGPRHKEDRAAGCEAAAREGEAVLAAGGTALEAVERAVVVLENDPRYNAGTGAVLTESGGVEHDAALMEGHTLRAGAVGALVGFANPIAVARAVLEDARHVFYAGEGAAHFAEARGFTRRSPSDFVTREARESLARFLATQNDDGPQGTVGAVARDHRGNLAAATSTGGTTGKRSGRIGDSPVLGAGTYADNEIGAVSATGPGEGILRVTLASRLLGRVAAGTSGENAARETLELMKARVGSMGGVLVVTHGGGFAWARSTESMPWALCGSGHLFSGE